MALENPEQLVDFARSLGLNIGQPDDPANGLINNLLRFADGFIDV